MRKVAGVGLLGLVGGLRMCLRNVDFIWVVRVLGVELGGVEASLVFILDKFSLGFIGVVM